MLVYFNGREKTVRNILLDPNVKFNSNNLIKSIQYLRNLSKIEVVILLVRSAKNLNHPHLMENRLYEKMYSVSFISVHISFFLNTTIINYHYFIHLFYFKLNKLTTILKNKPGQIQYHEILFLCKKTATLDLILTNAFNFDKCGKWGYGEH